ncbi:hypothetical protein Tco_1184854 [Tanacetum coccineum]
MACLHTEIHFSHLHNTAPQTLSLEAFRLTGRSSSRNSTLYDDQIKSSILEWITVLHCSFSCSDISSFQKAQSIGARATGAAPVTCAKKIVSSKMSLSSALIATFALLIIVVVVAIVVVVVDI